MRRVLTGGVVVTMNASGDVFAPGTVVIDGARIAYVGPEAQAPPTAGATIHRLDGFVVMPGLVNVHTHACMNLFRGLADDAPIGTWLSDYIWPLDARATPDDFRTAALAGCYEMLRNGITCIADRYSHMDTIVGAIAESGIRAIVTTSLLDTGRRPELEQAEALIRDYGVAPTSRISAGLGPHATDTCSTELLGIIRRLADRTGAKIFIHVAQSQEEVDVVRGRGVDGAARYLHQIGFLGPDVIAAHGIYLDPGEVPLLAKTDTRLAYCPSSNAKIEARIAPVDLMIRAGMLAGLGTDCAPSNNGMDLFQEMRCAGLLGKVRAVDPAFLPAEALVRMATIDGARVLGLDGAIGSLEAGKRADVITVRTNALHLQPWNDLYSGLVYCCTGHDVCDVFVDGAAVVANGCLAVATADDLIVEMRRITAERQLRAAVHARHAAPGGDFR